MLGIGFGEMILIAGVALVVIGPEKFPDFAKLVIRTVRDLRGYVDDVKTEMTRELSPLKKEMDSLKRIDPEKYIDSLTSDDGDTKPKSDVPANPSINEEDRKVMAGADADTYGEDPYGWQGSENGGYDQDHASCPDDTVGYGAETPVSDDVEGGGEAEVETDGVDSATDESVPTEADVDGEAPEATEATEDTEQSSGEPDLSFPEDDRIELSEPGEPDVWTGR